MKRSLEMPVADGHTDRRTYGRDQIYRIPVGSVGGLKNILWTPSSKTKAIRKNKAVKKEIKNVDFAPKNVKREVL